MDWAFTKNAMNIEELKDLDIYIVKFKKITQCPHIYIYIYMLFLMFM